MNNRSSGSLRFVEMKDLTDIGVDPNNYKERRSKNPRVSGAAESARSLKKSHNHLKRMLHFESLNYDPSDNDLEGELRKLRTKKEVENIEALRWLLSACVGLLMGVLASLVDWFIHLLSWFKFSRLASCASSSSPLTLLVALVGLTVPCASLAGGLVAWVEPLAAGSGIPEIKTYLNGIHLPGLMRLRTLGAKLGGVSFTIAAGLVAGKEGPFVHAGGLVGAGLSQMASPSLGLDFRWLSAFRTDADKRDFVCIGTAAGVATAFGAPIGGVLFAVEEGASFFSQAIVWRGFLATCIGVLTLHFLYQVREDGVDLGRAHFGIHRDLGLYNDDQARYDQALWWHIWEVPLFAAMGAIQGLLGAVFVRVNCRLAKWRQTYIPASRPLLRFLEVVALTVLTCVVVFVAVYVSPCRNVPARLLVESSGPTADTPAANTTDLSNTFAGDLGRELEYGEVLDLKDVADEYFQQWFCQPGEYSTLGQLLLTPLSTALKLLCHLGELSYRGGRATDMNTSLASSSSSSAQFEFDLGSVLTFHSVTFILMLITYGAAVPQGLFVPSLAVGAAFGQVVGQTVTRLVAHWGFSGVVTPCLHAYAMVGAAGMLGGCTRMTISITVLVMETTGALQLIIPLMLTVFAAKWAGDMYSEGIYHAYIKMRGVPFLEEHQGASLAGKSFQSSEKLSLQEVTPQGRPMTTLQPRMKVVEVVRVLRGCEHGAFPITPDISPGATVQDLEAPSCPVRFRLHGVMTRSQILKMMQHRLGVTRSGDPEFQLPSTKKELADILSKIQDTPFKALPLEQVEDLLGITPATRGLESSGDSTNGTMEDERTQRPRDSDPEGVASESAYDDGDGVEDMVIDFRPFMQRHPYVVHASAQLSRGYRLFRTLGLRHLFVTDEDYPLVMGAVTRMDISEEHANLVVGEKALNTASPRPYRSHTHDDRDSYSQRNPLFSE